MNRSRELAVNTAIIFVGKFCTQFVTFLLVPLYTHYFSTEEYGYIDLIQTYATLLAPIVILRFDSAIFRFLIDSRKNEKEKKVLISSSFLVILLQIFFLTLLYIILNILFEIKYPLATILNIISVSVSCYFLQLTRGIGKNVDYSIASIISAIVMVAGNFVSIIAFKLEPSCVLYVAAAANISCMTYLLFKNKLFGYIQFKSFKKDRIKELLRYSIPMIPDGLSWWVVNVSDRTIISWLLGVAANGVYAVSSKFSNILSSVFQVFNMSWQESASMHINERDRSIFFTKILNQSYILFFSICIFILVSIPLLFTTFIGDSYSESYLYIPILLLGNLFSAVANVIGGVYIAEKKTKIVARTTILAALLNIVINLALIRQLGIYAAAVSTLISYIAIAIYRYIDINKRIEIRFNRACIVSTLSLYIISATLYYVNDIYLNIINLLVASVILVIINRKTIMKVIKKVKIISKKHKHNKIDKQSIK